MSGYPVLHLVCVGPQSEGLGEGVTSLAKGRDLQRQAGLCSGTCYRADRCKEGGQGLCVWGRLPTSWLDHPHTSQLAVISPHALMSPS